MGAGDRRFQNRARRAKDNGEDFEDFVFECFRVAREERNFSKRLARGRDGAIDLIDRSSDAGAATVAECKYIGSGRAEDATARWREVHRNLTNNLPALYAEPGRITRSDYGAWLDPGRPVTRYRFCVTAEMKEREIAALESRIIADFAKLVAQGVEPLRTLAETPGAVRVLPWDWFAGEITEHPSLAFRWFRGLPPGVELFAAQDDAEATFRDFLNSGQLRYFSRDEYARDGIGRVDRGETELIARLKGEAGVALLITGPGGVGKTRLSWELANELARPEHGFDVYRLGRNAGSDSITQLAARYFGPASILLLVDYAEAAPRLAEIADAIGDVASNGGHRVRLVATCRASAVNQVKDAVSVLPFEEKSLGSMRTGEDDYVQWVAQSILSLEPIPRSAAIERVCRGVPALAAFAIFLFRRHRRQFDAQFGALHGLDDFENWAGHRIAALTARFGRDVSIGRTLARIGLALPLQADAFEAIEAESPLNRSLLRALVDDCWIEREGDCHFAAHDVLADALIARWVLEADHAATERAIDLLRDAARQGRLAGALVALERLALHPKLSEMDGSAVVDQLLARHPEQTLQCCGILLGGSLLGLEEKLALLHRSEALREALKEPVYDIGLSFLAAEAAHRKLSVAEVPALATLVELLDRASGHAHMSNMVLRRAYALDPERFRLRALANVGAFPNAEPTHFLLAQMLRSGEAAMFLSDAVRVWLESNAKAPRASFVYTAWLNAQGPIEAISEQLFSWLEAHGLAPDARFIFAAWLNAQGPIEAISEQLVAWLAAHRLAPEASFVFASWLHAKGPIEAVSGQLFSWLDAHRLVPEARFVLAAWLHAKGPIEAVSEQLLGWLDAYRLAPEASVVFAAWLNAKGPVEAVSEQLFSWLETRWLTPEASFVYAAWLNAKGPVKAVSEQLLAWLEAHGQTPEAQFVFTAWLNAQGPIEAVSGQLFSWLETHGQTLEARYVYTAWLDAKGSIDAVSAPLLGWITRHGATRYASHVYRAWFNSSGDFEQIRDQICAWLTLWHGEPDAAFVTRHLCKRHDLPEGVILAIASWSANFAGHEDSLDRLATLLGHAHEETLSDAGFIKLIMLTEDAIINHLYQDNLSSVDRSRLWAIAASLAKGQLFDVNSLGCIRIISRIIRSRRVFTPDLGMNGADFLRYSYRRVLNAALNALLWGELSIAEDAGALRDFVAWLRAGEPEIDRWERLLPVSGTGAKN